MIEFHLNKLYTFIGDTNGFTKNNIYKISNIINNKVLIYNDNKIGIYWNPEEFTKEFIESNKSVRTINYDKAFNINWIFIGNDTDDQSFTYGKPYKIDKTSLEMVNEEWVSYINIKSDKDSIVSISESTFLNTFIPELTWCVCVTNCDPRFSKNFIYKAYLNTDSLSEWIIEDNARITTTISFDDFNMLFRKEDFDNNTYVWENSTPKYHIHSNYDTFQADILCIDDSYPNVEGTYSIQFIYNHTRKVDPNLETSNKVDKVNHPDHYTWLKSKCGIEVIDIAEECDFCLGNVIKYVLRSGRKKELGYDLKKKKLEDLKKAKWYLHRAIDNLSKEI